MALILLPLHVKYRPTPGLHKPLILLFACLSLSAVTAASTRRSLATAKQVHMKKYLALVAIIYSFSIEAQDFRKDAMDSLIGYYRSLGWNGVVCVGNKDQLQYTKAFGYAQVQQQRPMETETRFKTESAGKLFTTTRILQLIEAGKLKTDNTLQQLLPDWQIPNAGAITIEHMLTHRSGLSSPWEHPDYVFGKIYTPEALKKIIETAPVIFTTPGKSRYYSNSAFMMLAEIIERIDQEPFEQSIRKHVFQPAGMLHTGSLNDSVLPANAAQPYYQVTATDFIPDNTRYGDGKASGAGGWMSTPGDLFKFAQAWLNGRLFSKATMQLQLTANGTVADTSVQWRYGMMPLSTRQKEEVIVGHNGGGRGFTVDLFFDAQQGNIVVFCSNQWGTAYGLTGRIFAVLANRSYTIPEHSPEIKLATLFSKGGGERFMQSPDSVYRALSIKPNERMLLNAYNNLDQLKRHREGKMLLAVVREQYPANAYAWYFSGDNAWAMQETATAQSFYEKALSLARETKNQGLETEIGNKLVKLGLR